MLGGFRVGWSKWGRSLSAVTVAGLLTTLSLQALGQTDEQRAGARTLANQGADAFEAGRFQEAVDLFQRAESLVHSPVHLLYLARGQAKIGRLVEARENYLKIVREPVTPGAPPALQEAKADAEKELEGTEARLSYVTLTLQGVEPARATVTIDGRPFATALVGVPTPVDPGEHTFVGQAPGFRSEPAKASFTERGRGEVTLVFTPAPVAPVAAAPPPPAPAKRVSDESASSGSWMRIGSYVGFGVGAVGLGAGTYFFMKAADKTSQADDLCTLEGDRCPESKRAQIEKLDDDAKAQRRLALGGFILGGVGVAAGVTLFILSGNSAPAEKTAKTFTIEPLVGFGHAGVRGTF